MTTQELNQPSIEISNFDFMLNVLQLIEKIIFNFREKVKQDKKDLFRTNGKLKTLN